MRIDPSHPPAGSFIKHLRSSSWSKLILFQTLPSLLLVLVAFVIYSVLSSPWISYWSNLLLLLFGIVFCYIIYPDKLIRMLIPPLILLACTFLAFHQGYAAERAFVIVSGACGILAIQVVNLLSIFSGTPCSDRVQAVCFATALGGPLLASTIHLAMNFPSAYLYGLLLSCSASMFNLMFNRVPSSRGIPGRDFDPSRRDSFQSPGMATPQISSPSAQFKKRL